MDPTTESVSLRVESVLPKPVTALPTPAIATATRRASDKLGDEFNMEDAEAAAIASAVVDPSTFRRAMETPERLHVPGGDLLAVRTDMWSRHVMPDPRNPRTSPSRAYPVSEMVGRDERTRFRPIEEPSSAPGRRPALSVVLESQEQLAWAAGTARDFIKQKNDWSESIRRQGVLTEVWVAVTSYEHRDGTLTATACVTVEGSSRMTAVHDILGVRSADVPYTRDDRRLRSHIRSLNEKLLSAGGPTQLDDETAAGMRSEIVPALVILGFEPHEGSDQDFATAVKSLVALRHVDPPEPWGEATENEALGDAVIEEVLRQALITPGMAEWLVGLLGPAEAAAAGFSPDPSVRAAFIARLFTSRDSQVHHAVRKAITSQSTRKRITTKLLFEIATSLILRSLDEDNPRIREGLRRWLKDAYGGEMARDWEPSFVPHDELAAQALDEVRAGEPGPASRHLAARSAYPLIVRGSLFGDLGAAGRDRQPDRRKPSEVIDRMRVSEHGIHQMRQILADSATDRPARAVDVNGSVSRIGDTEVVLTDFDLRRTFAAAGSPAPKPAAETPAELLHNALAELGRRILDLEESVSRVESVLSVDGKPAIDALGADPTDCQTWTDVLFRIVTRKLPVWQERHVMRHQQGPDTDYTDPDSSTLDEELVDMLAADRSETEGLSN